MNLLLDKSMHVELQFFLMSYYTLGCCYGFLTSILLIKVYLKRLINCKHQPQGWGKKENYCKNVSRLATVRDPKFSQYYSESQFNLFKSPHLEDYRIVYAVGSFTGSRLYFNSNVHPALYNFTSFYSVCMNTG